LVNGNEFLIGVGKVQNFDNLRIHYAGSTSTSLGYNTYGGGKWINGDEIDYASPAKAGDKITMTVDLRPFKKTVSFAKNGLDLGEAFGGLNFW